MLVNYFLLNSYNLKNLRTVVRLQSRYTHLRENFKQSIANGLNWKPGDRIVVFEEEFPANQYPWQRLASKGVTLEWLRADV